MALRTKRFSQRPAPSRGVPPGIIVIRDVPPTLSDTVQRIIALFDRQDVTFEGHFTVVTGDRIRQRPLPAV